MTVARRSFFTPPSPLLMSNIPLGRSGLSVPPLVFGANVLGWTVPEAQAFSLLDALMDRGLFFIDTADMYSSWVPGNQGGESETILGKWLARSGRRDQVVLATKVGMWTARAGLSRANIHAAVEDSLRRLQTDRIDVYFSHVDDSATPLEESLGAYAELIAAGKVRTLGASNHSAARVREALALSEQGGLPRYEVLQPHYNLVERQAYEEDLEPLAQEEGLGVVTYYALASGFLSGKYRTPEDVAGKARGQRLASYLNPHGLAVLDALDGVSARLQSTPAAVALAWLMARPSVTAPIVSATSVAQLDSLCEALRLQLSDDDIALLDAASQWQK